MSDISFNDAMECERRLEQLEQLAEFIKRHFPDGLQGEEQISLSYVLYSRGSWLDFVQNAHKRKRLDKLIGNSSLIGVGPCATRHSGFLNVVVAHGY